MIPSIMKHSSINHKLRNNINFSDNTTTFFKSYLTRRHQTVFTQYAQSYPRRITHGIPQGSTLSTTLFILYINDILLSLTHGKVFAYADDTTLIIAAENKEQLQEQAQTDINNLVHYFHRHNLVPNPTKTTYTIFHKHEQKMQLDLTIDGKKLQQERKVKVLGTIMQSNLSFREHIQSIVLRLQPFVQMFRYVNSLLPTHILLQLYYAHVYPLLIYGISIWGSDKDNTIIHPLIIIQKRIIRLICLKSWRTPTKPLFAKLRLLNIPNMYKYSVCMDAHSLIYPAFKAFLPLHYNNIQPITAIHNYNTRRSSEKHMYNDSKTGQYSRAAQAQWNKLPAYLRDISYKAEFKIALKAYLLHLQQS